MRTGLKPLTTETAVSEIGVPNTGKKLEAKTNCLARAHFSTSSAETMEDNIKRLL